MRDHIITEMRRLAAENDGNAPGKQAFVTATGIVEAKWRGKYWARWGDALVEAGFQPNVWRSKNDAETILNGIIAACRHYGRFPTQSELSLLRQSDPSIPSPRVMTNNLALFAFCTH